MEEEVGLHSRIEPLMKELSTGTVETDRKGQIRGVSWKLSVRWATQFG